MDTSLERHRRWLPAAAVLGVVVVLAGGAALGPWFASPGAATDIEVAGGIELHAATGWEVAGDGTAGDWAVTRLERGSGDLTVAATSPASTPVGLIERYIAEVLPATVRAPVFGEPEAVTLASGRPGVALGYVGTTRDGVPIEGVLVATAGGSRGVVFDAAAPQGQLVQVIDDAREMIWSAEVD